MSMFCVYLSRIDALYTLTSFCVYLSSIGVLHTLTSFCVCLSHIDVLHTLASINKHRTMPMNEAHQWLINKHRTIPMFEAHQCLINKNRTMSMYEAHQCLYWYRSVFIYQALMCFLLVSFCVYFSSIDVLLIGIVLCLFKCLINKHRTMPIWSTSMLDK
jgi:hypothetical protein